MYIVFTHVFWILNIRASSGRQFGFRRGPTAALKSNPDYNNNSKEYSLMTDFVQISNLINL